MKFKNQYYAPIIALFFCSCTLWALRPGDVADSSIGNLGWINCSPFKIGKVSAEERPLLPELRVVAFILTRNQSSDHAFAALENLRRTYRRQLLVAAITPDPANDAENFQRRHKLARVRLAVDKERNITPYYMAGSMLYPMAFIMDRDGMILWCGEAVDTQEAVARYFAGKLNIDVEKRTAKLLDEMQQRLRSGEFRKLRDIARQIFKISPGHPSALRMSLFTLENSRDFDTLWQLLAEAIRSNPQLTRLYFTAADTLLRNHQLRNKLPELFNSFSNSAAAPGERVAFCTFILARFADEAEAIGFVNRELPKITAAQLPPLQQGELALLSARLHYLLGDLPGALRFAERAETIYSGSSLSEHAAFAAKIKNFYQTLIKMRPSKN